MKKILIFLAFLTVAGNSFSQTTVGQAPIFFYGEDGFDSQTPVIFYDEDTLNHPVALCTDKKDTIFYPADGGMTRHMLRIWIQDTSLVLVNNVSGTGYPYQSEFHFRSKYPPITETRVFVVEDEFFYILCHSVKKPD